MSHNLHNTLVTLRTHLEPFLQYHQKACQGYPFEIDNKLWQAKVTEDTITPRIDHLIRTVAQCEYYFRCGDKIKQAGKNYAQCAIHLGAFDPDFIFELKELPKQLLALFHDASHAFVYMLTGTGALSDIGRDLNFDKLDGTGNLFLAKPKIITFLKNLDEAWSEQSKVFDELRQCTKELEPYHLENMTHLIKTLSHLKLFIIDDTGCQDVIDELLEKCLDIDIDSFDVNDGEVIEDGKIVLHSDSSDRFEYRFVFEDQAPLVNYLEQVVQQSDTAKAIYLTAENPIELDEHFTPLRSLIPTYDFVPTMIFVSPSGQFDDTLMAGLGEVGVSRQDIDVMRRSPQVRSLDVQLQGETWERLKQIMLEMSGVEHVSVREPQAFEPQIYDVRNLLGRPIC